MAKLNGVKAVAEAIEYNGVKYEKVDVAPKAGDILRVDESGYSYVTEDAYYEVDHVDNSDDPQIVDNDGDVFDGADIEYTLFRKVSESQAQQYREVKRPAEVGERIRIVKAICAGSYYKDGDELLVRSVKRGIVGQNDHVKVCGFDRSILDREYVVLEPIAEQADDIIEVDDVKYRKVDRAPKVGDFVYMIQSGTDLTKGKIYEVYSLYSDGDGRFRDNASDVRCFSRNSTTRQLVERIATAEDLERQVSELQTKLSEAEAELAAKKAEEKAAKRLKVGEYAKVLSKTRVTTHESIKENDIVKVVCDDETSHPFKATSLSGSKYGWFREEQLIRATDEEVAEAKRKLELSKFIEGTHVKLTVEEGNRPKHGWGGVKNGAVGVVNEVYGSVVRVDFPGFSRWSADPSELTILTAEEVQEEVKLAEEEVAKWAAIGRKVGEFKKGDVVKYDGGTGGNALNGHKDILTTIVEDDGPCGTVTDDLRYRLEKPDYVLSTNDTWTRGSHLKLVAPVESVVNLAVVK